MLANLPVARSAGARTVFLVTAVVTAAILIWSHRLLLSGQLHGLSPIFFVLFAAFDYPAACCALLILLVALFVPGEIPYRTFLRWIGEHPRVLAAACAGLLALGTLTIYHDHRLCMDEYTQFMQSQVFAAGHVEGHFPPAMLDWLIPRGFQDYFIAVSRPTGHIASDYWPSFALLLTPFTWLGIPWACNAVISALTLLALHRLALRLFGDAESAGLVVLLTAASPVFFANGISYYSMPAHLLANCLYALLLLEPSPRKCLAAGLVGSVALTLHNPVPHTLFALPWLIWVIRRENGLRLFCWLSAGYLPLCLLLGVGWFWLDGHLAHDGGVAGATNLARVSQFFSLPTSTVLLARLIGVAKVWLWAVPSLVVLACAGAWRWRADPRCRLLAASALLTLIGYVFVPVDQGHGWGYRYFHSAWLALPLLAAAALAPRASQEESSSDFASDDTRGFVVACAVLTLVIGVGFRAHQINGFITEDLAQLPKYDGTERRVVFVDASLSFYGADLVQNDPWLRGNVIRMLSHGAKADADLIRERFPGYHRVYADIHGTVWSSAVPALAGGPSVREDLVRQGSGAAESRLSDRGPR